jgi:hypothetical protein
MKSSKPKGKTPSLIGGSQGAPRKRLVERLSHCKRCSGAILRGAECFEIPHLGGSFSNPKPYCDGCFQSILHKTKADLDALFLSSAVQ